MNIAVFGGSGLVGKNFLAEALASSEVTKVFSIGRKELALQNKKLIQVQLQPMEPPAIKNLELAADVVVCALGTTKKKAGSKEAFEYVDLDLAYACGEFAKKQNAKLIVVSAMGASSSSLIFYNKVKGKLEDKLKNLDLKSLTIFRPSLLVGKREESRLTEGLAISVYNVIEKILPHSLSSKIGTEVSNLAKKMLKKSLAKDTGVITIKAGDI